MGMRWSNFATGHTTRIRMSQRARPLALFLVTLGALAASGTRAQDAESSYPATPMPTSWVELRGHRYTVEVAQTDTQRARGLMFRDSMARDHGMIFVHDSEKPLAYWMKNTHIPLDIFYFDAHRQLVSVAKNTPACDLGNACPPFYSAGPALYVLELNAGIADRVHAKKGDVLKFGPGIPASIP
jgi:uncharacterized membrane protein (UPF0127 family)